MQPLDEGAEVVRRAEARRRRVVARHLVAPRARERVLHHRHQLDVREAEVEHVVGQLVGELEIREAAVALERVQAPRAEVHLVDRDGAAPEVGDRAAREPVVVRPLVLRPEDDRGVLGRHLGAERVGVDLEQEPAVLRADLELVVRARLELGDEQLPDPRRAERAHRVQPPVPAVEVPDDADRARRRRPDGEADALDAVELADVRAEPAVELLVAALAGEVEVELAERGRNAVRVVERERAPARVVDLEPVAERQLGVRARFPSKTPPGWMRSSSTGSPPSGTTRTAVASGR